MANPKGKEMGVPLEKIRFNEHGDLLDPRTGHPVVFGDGVQFKEP